jgi:hypothetical protein
MIMLISYNKVTIQLPFHLILLSQVVRVPEPGVTMDPTLGGFNSTEEVGQDSL